MVFGSLGSTVVIMLRAINDTTNVAKVVAYVIRIIPSFAFGYGYNLLLNGKLILFIDYSMGYLTKPESIYISLEYAGSDALFQSKKLTMIFCPKVKKEKKIKKSKKK